MSKASKSLIGGSLAVAAGAALVFLAGIYGASEWKLRRRHEAPIVPLQAQSAPDLAAGRHMAELIGCWAGCHGKEGEGGTATTEGLVRITAPTLSQVLRDYSDPELVRLIRYGVKRDGTSALAMSSSTFWALGDDDLRNVIAHLRSQPPRPALPRQRDLTLRGRLALATGEWRVSADDVNRSLPRWGERPRNSTFERGRYLASVICSECHGLDFRGNPQQGGPSLVIVAAYDRARFEHLLRTGEPIGGRAIPDMSWMAHVSFTEREIGDLYAFLRVYHGIDAAAPAAEFEDRP